jgi:hypothetical protein
MYSTLSLQEFVVSANKKLGEIDEAVGGEKGNSCPGWFVL